MEYLEGKILLIDKPLEWTSFDVVNKIRSKLKRTFNIKKIKVGHAGTLDPLASGLMIVCTGRETKNIEKYQGLSKEYVAMVRLGATTPSCDLETEPDELFSYQHVTEELIREKLSEFKGEILQTPPAYSAKKIDGERAYKMARKNIEVKMRQTLVTIHDLELVSVELPDFTIRVSCSKGTYIRSLAVDLGKALNSGAHLANLCRTRIGDYMLKDAISIKDFEEILDKA